MQAAIPFPDVSPEIFTLPIFGMEFALRWYALAYIAGIVIGWRLVVATLRRPHLWKNDTPVMKESQVEDLLTWVVLGVILGGRLGYVLFYKPAYFVQNPAEILMLWQGGMSFHGGLVGVLVALMWQAKRMKATFLQLGDFVAPLVPIGLGAGRIGNFLNAELWGRTTDVPWAIIFPNAGNVPRHPSQLYEFALEGVLLFVILWLYSAKPRPVGAVSGVFLLGYGSFRFIVEYFREPDAHIGLYQMGLSQGQLLCLPMIALGIGLLVRAYTRQQQQIKQ